MRPSLPIALAALVLSVSVAAPSICAADPPATAGDPVNGKAVYTRECTGCHQVNQTLVGPKHCGVFLRRAGSVPDYAYSDAMKSAGFNWDAKHLDDFLKSPIEYLNGTNMGYAGLDSAKERADVIAFLRKAMNPAVCAVTAADLKQVSGPPPSDKAAASRPAASQPGASQTAANPAAVDPPAGKPAG